MARSRSLWTKDFYLLTASNMIQWASYYALVPTIPLLAARFGATQLQIGLISLFLTFSAIIARLLGGFAIDRYGRRAIHLVFLALYVLAFFSFNAISGLVPLFIMRFLQGIPFGVVTTASNTVASDLVPAERRGEGMSVFGMSQTAAMAIGPAVALQLLSAGGFGRVFSVGAGVAVVALVMAFLLRHPDVRNPAVRFSLQGCFEGRVVSISLPILFVTLGYGSIMSFITLYAQQREVANQGLFFTVYAIGMVLARAIAGRSFDRQGPAWPMGTGLGLLVAGYAMLALWQTDIGFLVAAFVIGVAMGEVQPSLQTMAINVVPAARRGAATATYLAIFDVGMGVGPALLGAVAEFTGSYATMYLLDAVMTLIPLAFFFVYVLPRYQAAVRVVRLSAEGQA